MKKLKKLKPKAASASLVETNEIVLPSHTNALGSIFGGMLISWIDIAAAICAQRHCGLPCVTASIDALHFLAPARLGDVINLKARVIFTGSTSLVIRVDAITENPRTASRTECCTADLSFVALDTDFRPTQVPPLLLKTKKDKAIYRDAQSRRKILLEQLKSLKSSK